jgi:hypothetical protein
VPVGLILLAIGLIVMLGRKWQQRGVTLQAAAASAAASELEYDSRLDEELRKLEND